MDVDRAGFLVELAESGCLEGCVVRIDESADEAPERAVSGLATEEDVLVFVADDGDVGGLVRDRQP